MGKGHRRYLNGTRTTPEGIQFVVLISSERCHSDAQHTRTALQMDGIYETVNNINMKIIENKGHNNRYRGISLFSGFC